MSIDRNRDVGATTHPTSPTADFARTCSAKSRIAGPVPPGPATVLLLAANPDDAQLRLDLEAREIETQIRIARYRDSIRFVSKWAVRFIDLLPALNDAQPRVLHFCGHGSVAGGILEGPSGGGAVIATEDLSAVIRSAGADVQLVVLNACYSGIRIEALAEHVACVIGMTAAIDDGAAIRYASALYGALAFGKSVATGHEQGCAAIGASGRTIPDLRCGNGIDASEVFLTGPMMPRIDADPAQHAAFLTKVVRRDNLLTRLPPGLARELAQQAGIQTLVKILADSTFVLGLMGEAAAQFSVDAHDVPLSSGAQHAWFSTLQLAAMRSPVTLGAILLRVRSDTGLSLPLCEQVLELLCERP